MDWSSVLSNLQSRAVANVVDPPNQWQARNSWWDAGFDYGRLNRSLMRLAADMDDELVFTVPSPPLLPASYPWVFRLHAINLQNVLQAASRTTSDIYSKLAALDARVAALEAKVP